MEPTGPHATQRPSPPPDRGVDLAPGRRPGVPREREPHPWPNTRYPPVRMEGKPSAPLHGRHGKRMPPVFSTAVPLRGLSGRIRRMGYGYPDHLTRHWLFILAGDQLEARGHRVGQLLKAAAPGLFATLGLTLLDARRGRKQRRRAEGLGNGATDPRAPRAAWGSPG